MHSVLLGTWLALGIGPTVGLGAAAVEEDDLLGNAGAEALPAGTADAEAAGAASPSAGTIPESSGQGPAAKSTTFREILRQGGITLAAIGLCSVVMLAVAAEAFWRMRMSRCAPAPFVVGVEGLLGRGEAGEALLLCRAETHLLARILAAGLERVQRGREAVDAAIDQAAARECERFRTRVNYLSVVSVISPMLGLLGTVLGMIGAFNKIALGGVLGDPSRLADDIGEALITTAGGLIVGVPAMTLYYLLRNRLSTVDHDVMEVATRLVNRWEAAVADQDGGEGGNGRKGQAAKPGRHARRAVAPVMRAPRLKPEPAPRARACRDAAAGAAQSPVQRRELSPCPACGEAIAEGAPACASCGVELEWEGS